jgi:hypothetical protein
VLGPTRRLPAKARISGTAEKQKSFGSFLQKRTSFVIAHSTPLLQDVDQHAILRPSPGFRYTMLNKQKSFCFFFGRQKKSLVLF